jgi:hypothetical protein
MFILVWRFLGPLFSDATNKIKTTISDLVQIPPVEFYKRSLHAVEDKINEKYSNKVLLPHLNFGSMSRSLTITRSSKKSASVSAFTTSSKRQMGSLATAAATSMSMVGQLIYTFPQ